MFAGEQRAEERRNGEGEQAEDQAAYGLCSREVAVVVQKEGEDQSDRHLQPDRRRIAEADAGGEQRKVPNEQKGAVDAAGEIKTHGKGQGIKVEGKEREIDGKGVLLFEEEVDRQVITRGDPDQYVEQRRIPPGKPEQVHIQGEKTQGEPAQADDPELGIQVVLCPDIIAFFALYPFFLFLHLRPL